LSALDNPLPADCGLILWTATYVKNIFSDKSASNIETLQSDQGLTVFNCKSDRWQMTDCYSIPDQD